MWPVGLSLYLNAHSFSIGVFTVMVLELFYMAASFFFFYTIVVNQGNNKKQEQNDFSNVIFEA